MNDIEMYKSIRDRQIAAVCRGDPTYHLTLQEMEWLSTITPERAQEILKQL